MKEPRYLNPYTDFGFKKLFGEEANKDLLTDFLNQLLPEHHQIAELNFKNSEALPNSPDDRRAVFDVYCKAASGEYFIVEMQKAKMRFFKDRSLFYSTFPIRDQQAKGDWNFKLQPVYLIAILDFVYDEEEERQKFFRDVALRDQDGDTFFEKLHFKFLQMPLFSKQESELETHFDKWCYFLKNLPNFDDIPAILKEPIFEKAFDTAEVSKLNHEQHERYLMSLLQYSEMKNALDTAVEDAENRAFRSAIIQVAEKLLRQDIAVEVIVAATNLSVEEVKALKNKIRKSDEDS
jgi:predicted transposase/invertase (TIGR01784 family)